MAQAFHQDTEQIDSVAGQMSSFKTINIAVKQLILIKVVNRPCLTNLMTNLTILQHFSITPSVSLLTHSQRVKPFRESVTLSIWA